MDESAAASSNMAISFELRGITDRKSILFGDGREWPRTGFERLFIYAAFGQAGRVKKARMVATRKMLHGAERCSQAPLCYVEAVKLGGPAVADCASPVKIMIISPDVFADGILILCNNIPKLRGKMLMSCNTQVSRSARFPGGWLIQTQAWGPTAFHRVARARFLIIERVNDDVFRPDRLDGSVFGGGIEWRLDCEGIEGSRIVGARHLGDERYRHLHLLGKQGQRLVAMRVRPLRGLGNGGCETARRLVVGGDPIALGEEGRRKPHRADRIEGVREHLHGALGA